MPAEVRWYNADETIMEVIFSGNWGIEDFVGALDKATKLSQSKKNVLVSVIINAEKSAGLPRGQVWRDPPGAVPLWRLDLHDVCAHLRKHHRGEIARQQLGGLRSLRRKDLSP